MTCSCYRFHAGDGLPGQRLMPHWARLVLLLTAAILLAVAFTWVVGCQPSWDWKS